MGVAGALAAPAAQAATAGALPPIGHVWTIVLENSDFLTTFGLGSNSPSNPAPLQDPYIATTLPSQGALVVNYFGTGHNSLDNYITMTSGQWPNVASKADCSDGSILGGGTSSAGAGNLTQLSDGQWQIPRVMTAGLTLPLPDTTRNGCTFPAAVKSLPDQLDQANPPVSWKGYMEDMDASPATVRSSCQTATSSFKTDATGRNVQDMSTAKAYDGYARKHDPFEYYHSITDRQAYCDAHDVGQTPLAGDLSSIATTPQYSFLTPNLCDDAHDDPCNDPAHRTGGLARADAWAKQYIPMIMNSAAYKKDGLIVLTLDEGAEPASCCGESKGPNLPADTDNGTTNQSLNDSRLAALQPVTGGTAGSIAGPGGGQIGTVLLSPFITPGTVDTTGVYNHCSYLRTMEDIFHIGPTADIPGSDGQGHLACAGQSGLPGQPVADYGYANDIFGGPGVALGEGPLPWVAGGLVVAVGAVGALRSARRFRPTR